MNSSIAHMISAMNKHAAPIPAGTPFMQNPMLMGGTALGVMSGDNPMEMAVKGGAGYMAASALQRWLEQNGHVAEAAKVAETIKTQEAAAQGRRRAPSAARLARRRGAQGASQPALADASQGAQPSSATSQAAPVAPPATAATPMTSSRLRQELVNQRAGMGGLNREIKSLAAPMAEMFGGERGAAWSAKVNAENQAYKGDMAAKERQLSDLYQKEQIDNIKMRENAARLQAEKYGMKGQIAEDYVAKQVPEVRTHMGNTPEAPPGKFYGATADRVVKIGDSSYYRVNDPATGKAIFTDSLGNQVADKATISNIRKQLPSTTNKGPITISDPRTAPKPVTTYRTDKPSMDIGYKTSLGRGIGAGVGGLAAGYAGKKLSDALDLDDTASGIVTTGAGLLGGVGGSVAGGKILGGAANPFTRLNEFGVSGPSKGLMSRIKPAGKLGAGLALLAGGGWLANKLFGGGGGKKTDILKSMQDRYIPRMTPTQQIDLLDKPMLSANTGDSDRYSRNA